MSPELQTPVGSETPGQSLEPQQHSIPSPGGKVNVGTSERILSLLGGAALVGLGVRRRTLPGLLATAAGSALAWRGYSGHCPAYAALNMNTADRGAAAPGDYFSHGIHVEESLTVSRSPQECFAFWRNFENLPHFMYYLESVQCESDKRSRWKVKAPAGTNVEWDAEIINEEPNQLIAWRSLANAEVDNAGSVRFLPAPGDRGTEVKVVIDYIPPAGRFGQMVAKVFGRDPQMQVREDLRRFKQIMETGELATVEGQPQGSCC